MVMLSELFKLNVKPATPSNEEGGCWGRYHSAQVEEANEDHEDVESPAKDQCLLLEASPLVR